METTRRKNDKEKMVYVTVGTTQFNQLIKTMCEADTLKALQMLGYTRLLLQLGSGEFVPDVSGMSAETGMAVDWYKYKPSIKEDIERASLVISHAGAGSCLETLGARKPLLVVINEELMGNHQLELAFQLYADQHLFYCTCSTLVETLQQKDFTSIQPFTPGKPAKFAEFLDNVMGFS